MSTHDSSPVYSKQLRYSIQYKINVILVAVVTFLLIGFGSYDIWKTRKTMLNQLAESSNILASSLSKELAFPLWELDEVLADEIVNVKMQANPDIVSILVFDTDRKTIFTGSMKDINGAFLPYDENHIVFEDIVKFSAIEQESYDIGYVRVGLTKNNINEKINKFLFVTMVRVLIVNVLLITILSLLIRRIIISPLKNVAFQIQCFRDGDMDNYFVLKSDDEIGLISEALNQLVLELKQTTVSVEVLEKEQKRFYDVSESSGDWIWEIDSNGRYVYSSPAVKQILGYEDTEMIGKHMYSFFHPDEFESLKLDFIDLFKRHESFKGFQSRNLSKQGQEVILETNGMPIFNKKGEFLGYRGVDRDISERKRVEAEREETLHRLEDAYFSLEAEAMKSKLLVEKSKMSAKAKSEFLANMSHEIRTPMNAILGCSKMLQKGDLSVKQRKYVNTVISSGDMLLSIIDDILDVAKLESGKITIESITFELRQLCQAVVGMIIPRLADKKVELCLFVDNSIPDLLIGDPTRIKQIIVNLLGNAVKFTEEGSIGLTVNQDISYAIDGQIKLRFCVSDTGIGIAKEKVEHIFDRFTQEDYSITRKYGGSGLGLSICKALTEAMCGNIWVESEPGNGSRFFFDIVLKDARCVESNDISKKDDLPVNCNLKGKQILVVEDNSTNQMLMKEFLKVFECDVVFVNNGKEAVDLLKGFDSNNIFDICFMDLQMPVMGGIEATQIIRRDISKDLPIIALSAAVLHEDQKKAELAGMNGFLAKPIDIDKLYSFIIKYCQSS